MGSLDRLVKRVGPQPRSWNGGGVRDDVDDVDDATRRLGSGRFCAGTPTTLEAFGQLAEVVRRHAGEGHDEADQQRAADDAVWALAEELAHSGRAWYPLMELARLSVHDDREAALRRLATASRPRPTGEALATGLQMLRDDACPTRHSASESGIGAPASTTSRPAASWSRPRWRPAARPMPAVTSTR